MTGSGAEARLASRPGRGVRGAVAAPGSHAVRSEHAVTALGTVAVSCAVGVLAVSLAYWAGRAGHEGLVPNVVYWVGQVLIVAPVALRLLSPSPPPRTWALGALALLVTAEYVVKFCYSPVMFTFPDELQHWRGTQNILRTGELFTTNASLPISPSYPGLEEVTAAFSSVTGMSVFVSGLLVVGAAHLTLVALLFALFTKVSGSERIAALGASVYVLNPHFTNFDSMFIYQVLALPFLVLALYAVFELAEGGGLDRSHARGLWVVLAASLVTVTVTHHVTSYVLTGLLGLLVVVTLVRSGWSAARVTLVAFVVAASLSLTWALTVAPRTLGYFTPALTSLAEGLLPASGTSATQTSLPAGPVFDRLLVVAFILGTALLVAAGIARVRNDGRRGDLTITFAIASLGYYAVVATRVLVPDGAELAGRALTFVFLPLSYVAALGLGGRGAPLDGRAAHGRTPSVERLVTRFGRVMPRGRFRRLVPVALATTIFLGSIAAGWPPYWERLPGSYQAGGFERAVSPQGVIAAKWALARLGAGNRFGVDRGNEALLGAYGRQDVVRDPARLYYSATIGSGDRAFLRESSLRYLLVDRRLARSLPDSGQYFPIDPRSGRIRRPIPMGRLDKYDGMPGVNRLYDSGSMVIYDLRRLSREE